MLRTPSTKKLKRSKKPIYYFMILLFVSLHVIATLMTMHDVAFVFLIPLSFISPPLLRISVFLKVILDLSREDLNVASRVLDFCTNCSVNAPYHLGNSNQYNGNI